MSKNVSELSGDTFNKEVLNKKGFSLVDFWAPWCGPCRMMAPIIDEISKEIENVKFYKVNVDENQDLSSAYRVSSIPCFILFNNGKAIATRTGGSTKEDFVNWIKENKKSNNYIHLNIKTIVLYKKNNNKLQQIKVIHLLK